MFLKLIIQTLKIKTIYFSTFLLCSYQIVTFENGDVFNLAIVVFNGATEGPDYSNMSKVDTSIQLATGSMKIVFLNKYVNSLLV